MDRIRSPEDWEAELGETVKAIRLQKNIDRETLSEQAGVSVGTLRNLENGAGTTLGTLIRVVRALGREDWLAALAPAVSVNPLHVRARRLVRQRASRKRDEGAGDGEAND